MIEKEVPNEFLLLLEEGASPDQRARGAYYKSIERKMILKKRRANVGQILVMRANLADVFLASRRVSG